LVLGVLVAAVFSSALAEGRDTCEMQLTVLEDLGAVSVVQTITYQNRTGARWIRSSSSWRPTR
jgi:hypothetical protein